MPYILGTTKTTGEYQPRNYIKTAYNIASLHHFLLSDRKTGVVCERDYSHLHGEILDGYQLLQAAPIPNGALVIDGFGGFGKLALKMFLTKKIDVQCCERDQARISYSPSSNFVSHFVRTQWRFGVARSMCSVLFERIGFKMQHEADVFSIHAPWGTTFTFSLGDAFECKRLNLEHCALLVADVVVPPPSCKQFIHKFITRLPRHATLITYTPPEFLREGQVCDGSEPHPARGVRAGGFLSHDFTTAQIVPLHTSWSAPHVFFKFTRL